jgi:hypothetical protein
MLGMLQTFSKCFVTGAELSKNEIVILKQILYCQAVGKGLKSLRNWNVLMRLSWRYYPKNASETLNPPQEIFFDSLWG